MIARCSLCQQHFDTPAWGEQDCPHCGARVQLLGGPVPAVPQPLPPGEQLPWEARTRLGFWSAGWQTVKRLLSDPRAAFAQVRSPGWHVLLYAMVWAGIGIALTQVYNTALQGWLMSLAGEEATPMVAVYGLFGVMAVLITPFSVALGTLIDAAFVHLALVVLSADRRGYEGTLTAVGYAQTPMILGVVPFVGSLAGMVWSLYLKALGVKTLHGTTRAQALIAVLWMPTLALAFVLLFLGAVLAMAFAAASQAG